MTPSCEAVNHLQLTAVNHLQGSAHERDGHRYSHFALVHVGRVDVRDGRRRVAVPAPRRRRVGPRRRFLVAATTVTVVTDDLLPVVVTVKTIDRRPDHQTDHGERA